MLIRFAMDCSEQWYGKLRRFTEVLQGLQIFVMRLDREEFENPKKKLMSN